MLQDSMVQVTLLDTVVPTSATELKFDVTSSSVSVANGQPAANGVNGKLSNGPGPVVPFLGTTDHNGALCVADLGRGSPSSPSDPAPNKLFVGGLSWQTTPEKLRDYFSQYGTVTDVLIMKDPLTQRSRGFGFITFAETSSVDKVLTVACHLLDGKKIDPKHATPKSKKGTAKTKKIFVGGLSQETTVEEVKAYFAQYGKVEESVLLMDNQTKRHRGFGFVTMASEDAVERICEIHYHMIKGKRVECKKALPREAVAAMTAAAQLAAPPGLTGTAAAALTGSPLTAASLNVAAANHHNSLALFMARQRLALAAACGLPGLQGAGGMLSLLQGPGVGGGGPLTAHHSVSSSGLPATSQAVVVSTPSIVAPISHPNTAAYGKVLAYNGLSSAYRYSPYAIPQAGSAGGPYSAAAAAAAAANQAAASVYGFSAAAASGSHSASHQQPAGVGPTAVDMSAAFPGVDWMSLAASAAPTMYAA